MPLGENSETGAGAQHQYADRPADRSSTEDFGDEGGDPEKHPNPLTESGSGSGHKVTSSAMSEGTFSKPELTFDQPRAEEGSAVWQLVSEIGNLDLNSRYFYLLWGRDFADASVVVRDGDRIAGFIVGYRRPQATDTLFVWQVAVSSHYRRQGLARRMLDHLWNRLRPLGVNFVESTVTPDNKASMRLFESFAEGHNAELTRDVLFSEQMLGEGHEPEVLHRIGPVVTDT